MPGEQLKKMVCDASWLFCRFAYGRKSTNTLGRVEAFMLRITNAEKFLKLETGIWCERIRHIYLVSENDESL